MNLADVIVSGIIIGILVFAFCATKSKKKDGCGSCSQNCSSCTAFSNLYDDYKKDRIDEKK